MLSNTAIPKYYGQFREAVIRGEIPVCQEVSMEMNRIDALIAHPGVYYDDEAVEGWVRFCEEEMCLIDGSDVHLVDSFKLWGEQVFGWWYFVKKSVYTPTPDGHGGRYVNKYVKYRLTNKQFLIVGRSAAKSLYSSYIQAYGLTVDTTTTEQIAVGPTKEMGDIILAPIRTAISRAKGRLFAFLTEGSLQNTTGSKANRVKLASTKKGIENFITRSSLVVKPLDIEKLQGGHSKYASLDEWLSCDIREDPISAIEQGAMKIKDYLIIATSSEGTIRNGAGDSIKMELSKILRGEYINPFVSIWWYKLDDISEVGNPAMWKKANPNLGSTVEYESYQQDVAKMEANPSVRNDTLAKRFGIPSEGYTYFFTYNETIPHNKHTFWSMPCALGADLSRGDDFCAFTFLFPLTNGCFGIKTISYISSLTLMKLQPAMRVKYDELLNEGTLIVLEGSILDMTDVYDDLDRHIVEHDYDVRCIGYDPYNAKEFIERWASENGPFGVVKVIQGSKTESVPLGELKKLAEQRMLIFDEELMKFAMENCIVSVDTNGNRKLMKKRNEDKIDNVAAMMDAFVAYKLNKEAFE